MRYLDCFPMNSKQQKKSYSINYLDFFYKPIYGSPQFSTLFLKWVLEKNESDDNFFAA